MKGVCAPGQHTRRGGRRGPQRCGPLLFTAICLHLLIQDAENAISPSPAAVIETVHGSLKSNEYVRKTLENG